MPDLAVVVADVGDAVFPCGQDRPGVADEGDGEGRVPQELGRRVRPRLAHDDAVVAFVREGAEVRGRQLVRHLEEPRVPVGALAREQQDAGEDVASGSPGKPEDDDDVALPFHGLEACDADSSYASRVQFVSVSPGTWRKCRSL